MLPHVLPVSRGDKEWYLDAARTRLLFGVASHRRTRSASSRSPVESFGQTGARRHIFIHNGAPQALFELQRMRLGTGHSGATLVSLHTVKRVPLSQANIWSSRLVVEPTEEFCAEK